MMNQPSGSPELPAVDSQTNQQHKRRRRGHETTKAEPPSASPKPNAHYRALDCSLPQPQATLDPSDYQERPAAPLRASLSCVLCGELLAEAMTSLECGHTYCYDCIEAKVVIGGNRNICPTTGCVVVLGPSPFDHHRLQYDSLLDSLVQKIFPRPELDAALAVRRAEREEATRMAREEVNGAHGHGHGGARRHGGS